MDITKVKKAQQAIQNDEIINYDMDTLRYVQRPIGKALHRGRGRPRMAEEDKAKPSDRVVCNLCKKEFVRSNRTYHNRTQRHQLYSKINTKLAKLVIDE